MKISMLTDSFLQYYIKRLPFITAAFFVFVQCTTDNENQYQYSSEGLSYKFHRHSADTAMQPKIGDIVALNLSYATISDSILFSSKELPGVFRIELLEPEVSNVATVETALLKMHVGDSLSFYLDALTFFQYTKHLPLPDYLKAGDSLKFNASLLGIESRSLLAQDKENLHARLQFAEDEMIQEYSRVHFEGIDPEPSGLYIKVFVQGQGSFPQPGEKVALDYTMSYLNGEVFYSTVKKPEPFEFEMGDGMVIPGLESGVAHLKRGSHALLLIPSHLAYGAEGYKKIIRPFTPLVFEVRVLR